LKGSERAKTGIWAVVDGFLFSWFSPLNSWTKLSKQFSPLQSESHEQNQKKIQPRRPLFHCSGIASGRPGWPRHIETCRKYNLSPSLLRKWREKYLNNGKDGLKDNYPRIDPQLRALEEENERLKRIVARQALELEVKNELLKKTPIQPRKS